MYTDDVNAQIVLSLLKKYNIKKIVISPGTTNVPIARSVQNDDFFEKYSVVDERAAAYFAGGLAFASGEPVVISCTGATASRNYLSGLTEAYYRHLPVIALTSQHHSSTYQDLVPQMTDRTVSQNDIKRFAAFLPYVKDKEDYKTCVSLVNQALHMAISKGSGPVHINLPVSPAYSFKTEKLPDVPKIEYYNYEDVMSGSLQKELQGKRIGIYIGSHRIFSAEELKAINAFATAYDAIIFYDHTSGYTGEHGILISVASELSQVSPLPDILIDIGSICGDYSGSKIFSGRVTWRISEDGVYHNRYNAVNLQKVIECSERFFFSEMAKSGHKIRYFSLIKKNMLHEVAIPTLPLSNTYVAAKLSKEIPKGSYLHLGILNSLRNMNFFETDPTVVTSSNVGGFGIDGALATALGQSMNDKTKLVFCLLGDLAFFYDMNSLGNRHISNNLRIILINNERGVEFRLNKRLETQWGSDSDEYIAAKGHFGSAKGWVESMGLHYMAAYDKQSFDKYMLEICNPDVNHFKHSAILEVFTKVSDEKIALDNLKCCNQKVTIKK